MATVSESVSKSARVVTTRAEFLKTPLKLAYYSRS